MRAGEILLWLTILVLVAMITSGTLLELATGLPRSGRYLARLWPPRLSALPGLLPAAWETAVIALFGTTLGFLTAIPFSFLASRGLAGRVPYVLTRLLLLAMRSIPAMILGILFVSAVGLGPIAGIMGIWIYSGGVLGKLMSEAFEAADQDILDAAAIDGANKFQSCIYVLLPMQANAVLSFLLYRFESSFRAATLVGVVGAGGLGMQLTASMGLFDYGKTSMIICLILVTVLMLDIASRTIRSKL